MLIYWVLEYKNALIRDLTPVMLVTFMLRYSAQSLPPGVSLCLLLYQSQRRPSDIARSVPVRRMVRTSRKHVLSGQRGSYMITSGSQMFSFCFRNFLLGVETPEDSKMRSVPIRRTIFCTAFCL